VLVPLAVLAVEGGRLGRRLGSRAIKLVVRRRCRNERTVIVLRFAQPAPLAAGSTLRL